MKGTFIKKSSSIFMAIVLFLGILLTNGASVFAATTPPKITTANLSKDLFVGDLYTFTVTASYSTAANVDFEITSTEGAIPPTKTKVTYSTLKRTSTATFTYSNSTEGTFVFSVVAFDKKYTTIRSTPISVTIRVIPKVPPTVVNYVALGDSIATGTTGLSSALGLSKEYSYVYRLRDYIDSLNNTDVVFNNLSVDGHQSDQFLNKLKTDEVTKQAISNATLITITMGGNNLMYAAYNTSTKKYDFNSINTEVAKAGVVKFRSQWEESISIIKNLNPNAKIIVLTVYNPYNVGDKYDDFMNSCLSTTVTGACITDQGLGINDVILKYKDQPLNGATSPRINYEVANVYQNFYNNYRTSMKTVTHFYDTVLFIPAKDPHPNSTGQQKIFEYNLEKYLQYSN